MMRTAFDSARWALRGVEASFVMSATEITNDLRYRVDYGSSVAGSKRPRAYRFRYRVPADAGKPGGTGRRGSGLAPRRLESRGWIPTMLTEGVWAEVKVGKEHLRLFSEHNVQGVQASVYNVTTKSWIAPSEPVEDIEQGKERAVEHARAYLKLAANADLPSFTWKESRSR
jgi:hypothetical protein